MLIMISDQDNPIKTSDKDEKKLKIESFTKIDFVFREKKKSQYWV